MTRDLEGANHVEVRWDATHAPDTYRDGVGLERFRCCLRLVVDGHDLMWARPVLVVKPPPPLEVER